MASLAKRTKAIRSRKATKAGAARKKNLVNNGTTPKFAIHPEKKD